VQVVRFHPNSQLMLTAALDKRLKLFQATPPRPTFPPPVQIGRISLPILEHRTLARPAPCHARLLTMKFTTTLAATVNTALQVDGKHNSKVQSVFFEDLPITSAAFSADGAEVTETGPSDRRPRSVR
jgi:hypothetical protein